MYRILLLLVVLQGGNNQNLDIDQATLDRVFGTPSTLTVSSTTTLTPLEDITVRPTDSSTIYRDNEGYDCKCVPYYLCDNNGTNIDPLSIDGNPTGYGELDIRFGDEENTRQCQESVEICCREPKTDGTLPTPEPYVARGCGYRNPQGVDFTITGGSGKEALFGEYPWVVALLDAHNDSCAGAGVLIHPNVVLTGAHLVYKYQALDLMIRAGEWDTQTTKERLPFQERRVDEIYLHHAFNSKNLYNDIALLRLSEPVQLDKHINVACLPKQGESFDEYTNCVANGWGKDIFGKPGRYAVILKKVELNMLENRICQTLLQRTRLGPRFRLDNSFVCAGGEEGKDVCQGDGGAPLACPFEEERYKVTGLVGWGIGCGQRNVPGVYTRVALFREWLDDKMTQWGFDTNTYDN